MKQALEKAQETVKKASNTAVPDGTENLTPAKKKQVDNLSGTLAISKKAAVKLLPFAAVTKAGKVKAKAKGKCTIYIYAHNGVCKQVKITVK